MEAPLHPTSELDDLLESYLNRHARGGHPVYICVLLSVLVTAVLLPFIHVDVRVVSPGIIRPTTEIHEIRSPVGSFAETVLTRRGERVEKGQNLILLGTGALEQRLLHVERQREERRRRTRDVETLLSSGSPQLTSMERISSPEYRHELSLLRAEIDDLELRKSRSAAERTRLEALFTMDLVPRTEFERVDYEYRQLLLGSELLLARHLSRWAGDLARLRTELSDLRETAGVLHEEGEQFAVRAPVAGTVEQLMSVSPGAFVRAGDLLVVISPDAPLHAEVYVSSADVGLLSIGMPARLNVDAFNHFEWGSIPGRVSHITEDFVTVEQRPVFRVEISLEETHLELRSGARGDLRKGMSVQARFVLTRRSLLQLLRDRVVDWVEPVGSGPVALAPTIAR